MTRTPEDKGSNKLPARQVQNREEQVARFVSKIKNLELHIGEHVLSAV